MNRSLDSLVSVTSLTPHSYLQTGSNGHTKESSSSGPPVTRHKNPLLLRTHSGLGVLLGSVDCSTRFGSFVVCQPSASTSSAPGFHALSAIGFFRSSQDTIMHLTSKLLNIMHVVEEIHYTCERFLADVYEESRTNFNLGARKTDPLRHAIFSSCRQPVECQCGTTRGRHRVLRYFP